MFAGGQVWRLLTSLLPSGSLVEGCVSWFLLYRFRTFERQMGSARFSLFLVLVAGWAVAARAAALAVLPLASVGGIASGPYELIFALFVYYFRASRWGMAWRGVATCAELTRWRRPPLAAVAPRGGCHGDARTLRGGVRGAGVFLRTLAI